MAGREHEELRYRESLPTDADIDFVTKALGRQPRGFRGVPCRDAQGRPQVIRVASVVGGQPFPTLFWLVCPALRLDIDRLEARGVIELLQAEVVGSVAAANELRADHEAHAALRLALMAGEDRAALDGRGLADALAERGVGGIVDFSRIKCLHAFYAAHLVQPNLVGRWLEERHL